MKDKKNPSRAGENITLLMQLERQSNDLRLVKGRSRMNLLPLLGHSTGDCTPSHSLPLLLSTHGKLLREKVYR